MNKETQIKKNTAAGAKKRRRYSLARLALILFVALLLVTGGIVWLLLGTPEQQDTSLGLFRIKEVTVSGDTRYDPQELIATSQIAVGQSVFGVREQRAVENLLARYPYIDRVSIDKPAYDRVQITVTETQELAAVALGDEWLVVGSNGRGLLCLPREGVYPLRHLYLCGVTLAPDADVGRPALLPEDLKAVLTLRDACLQNGLEDVGEMDLTPGAVRLMWRGQITLLLGSLSKAEYQIRLAASSLPPLLEKYGAHVRAVYDLRAFADPENLSPQAYFTPEP